MSQKYDIAGSKENPVFTKNSMKIYEASVDSRFDVVTGFLDQIQESVGQEGFGDVATKNYVDTQVSSVNTTLGNKIDTNSQAIEAIQSQLSGIETTLSELNTRIEKVV